MGHVVEFPRLQRSENAGLPCPPIHHSVGVGTIVALLRAHRPRQKPTPEIEEKARLDAWLAAGTLPDERQECGPTDHSEAGKG